jgi:hypothetical protein
LFCFVWSFVVVAGVVARLDQSIQGIEVSSAVLKEKSTLNKLVADEDIDSDAFLTALQLPILLLSDVDVIAASAPSRMLCSTLARPQGCNAIQTSVDHPR